ncbi:MAG: VPLPA-CTERM sorting domain-containing protein [Pseudomonadota bacterium]
MTNRQILTGLKVLTVAFGASMASSMANAATVITFDEAAFEASTNITNSWDFDVDGFLTDGTPVIGEIVQASEGIYGAFTYQTTGNSFRQRKPGSFGAPVSMVGPDFPFESSRLILPTNTTAFGADIYHADFGLSPIGLVAFDASNNRLIETEFDVSDYSTQGTFFGLFSDVPIHRLEFSGPRKNLEFLDDLRAGTQLAPVPLPSGLALFLVSLGAFAGVRRLHQRVRSS